MHGDVVRRSMRNVVASKSSCPSIIVAGPRIVLALAASCGAADRCATSMNRDGGEAARGEGTGTRALYDHVQESPEDSSISAFLCLSETSMVLTSTWRPSFSSVIISACASR